MQKIVLASNNAGKLREFNQILAPKGVETISQGSLGITEAAEPYFTFIENALTKARHASKASGLAALADDSGICVPALQGAPGVFSARYAQMAGGEKSDSANNQHLLTCMEGMTDRRAYYYATIVVVRHPDDPCPMISSGLWWGQVLTEAKGEGGFGYDPLFWLPEHAKTAAQMSADEKNLYSHRGQSLRTLMAQWDTLWF